jgi:hypothetical protein
LSYGAQINDVLPLLSNLLALSLLENFVTYSCMMLDEYNT